MKREYIHPVTLVITIVASIICQSLQQYKLEGDTYDSDSD